jgi:DNA gyrase subunit A
MAVADLRVMGRATQGVRLIKVREDDAIAAVAKAMKDDDDDVEILEETNDGTTLDNNETQTENNE